MLTHSEINFDKVTGHFPVYKSRQNLNCLLFYLLLLFIKTETHICFSKHV